MEPTTKPQPFRRITLLLSALIAAGLVLGAGASAVAAASPVRLEAGPQTGYTFTADGAIVTKKTVSFSKPANVATDDRRWIGTRGVHLRITSGTLAGYYVRESPVAYVMGLVVTATYSPAVRVAFPAGMYLGYTWDTSWKVATTKKATLAAASGASASRRAMINGRPFAEIVNGIWAGYWVPIVSPSVLSANKLSCSVPAKVATGSQEVFKVLPGAVNQLALTFDMGGRLTPGVDIVKRLITDRVCTTFFPTGAMSATTEGRAILALIGAHPELFEVGNHTYHHCNLVNGTGGSPTTAPCPQTVPTSAFIQKELTDAAAVIKANSGLNPTPYWRPPYGAYNTAVRNAVAAVGYSKTVLWTIDTIDWRPVSATPTPGPSAAQIADKVVANAVNGSVVLMHLGGYNTFDALPSMVLRLRAKGLTPTDVTEILR
jgi:peptidoglycan/xylan/chitin deacetylase (PgdA/CDA1 family)